MQPAFRRCCNAVKGLSFNKDFQLIPLICPSKISLNQTECNQDLRFLPALW
jgi:hypothetical protein